jgi:phage antirepressor YoqD-like protein
MIDTDQINEIISYKKANNSNLKETAKYFKIGINRLRNLLKTAGVKIPKKTTNPSTETIEKIKNRNILTKNGPLLNYDWDAEYKLFIEQNTKDITIGIKNFCKNRGYSNKYLLKYIRDNQLYQPRGIPKRTDEWRKHISIASKGKVNNPKGSNGKLLGKKLNEIHRTNIRTGLVKKYYNISMDEWVELIGKRDFYYREVWRITNQQNISMLDNFDKRGNSGDNNNYQLDHIYPISLGFINNISPKIIGSILNLQMIPWQSNRKKSNKLILDYQQHLEEIKKMVK